KAKVRFSVSAGRRPISHPERSGQPGYSNLIRRLYAHRRPCFLPQPAELFSCHAGSTALARVAAPSQIRVPSGLYTAAIVFARQPGVVGTCNQPDGDQDRELPRDKPRHSGNELHGQPLIQRLSPIQHVTVT
ncbi:Uncharacterized protein (Fragment), partial [Pseudomonas [fluorescens] SBW25]